jgi:hypothetical protein
VLEDFDGLAILGDQPGNRRQTWRFVRALAAELGRPLTDSDGYGVSELRAVEERSGVATPSALAEAYLAFGRRTDLTATQDKLVPPHLLRIGSDGVMVFRVEVHDCARWGVRAADLDQDDPPVVLDAGDGWVPYADHLSLTLVEMVLFEAMMSAPEGNCDNRHMNEPANAILNTTYSRLPLPDFPHWAINGGPPVRWFTGPDVLLRDDGGTWLWVLGRTPAAVQSVRDLLPGEWMVAPGGG